MSSLVLLLWSKNCGGIVVSNVIKNWQTSRSCLGGTPGMILNRSAAKSIVNFCSAGRELKFSYLFINTYLKPFVNFFKGAASGLTLLFAFSRSGRVKQSGKHGDLL